MLVLLSLSSAVLCSESKGPDCPWRNNDLSQPSTTPSPKSDIITPRMIQMSDMVAGEGGDYYFDDQLYYYELVGIDSFKIWHGEQVDGIEVVYRKKDGGLFEAEHHGG